MSPRILMLWAIGYGLYYMTHIIWGIWYAAYRLSKKVMLIFLSQFTYFDYIESLPRTSCSLPTITWFRQPENRIPENFKENQKWDLKISRAPNCPKTATFIRLIKTTPFNFELRDGFWQPFCETNLAFLLRMVIYMVRRLAKTVPDII